MSYARRFRRYREVKDNKPYRCCKDFMSAKPEYQKDGLVLHICMKCGKTKYLPLREE